MGGQIGEWENCLALEGCGALEPSQRGVDSSCLGLPSFGRTNLGLHLHCAVDSATLRRRFDRRPPELLSTSASGIVSFIGYEWERCLLTIEPISCHPFCSSWIMSVLLKLLCAKWLSSGTHSAKTIYCPPSRQAMDAAAAATSLSWCTSFPDFYLVWRGFSKF